MVGPGFRDAINHKAVIDAASTARPVTRPKWKLIA